MTIFIFFSLERWKKYQQSAANDDHVKSWAIQACHRILIYLGDLGNYEHISLDIPFISKYKPKVCFSQK